MCLTTLKSPHLRKSIMVSKAMAMVDLTMALFARSRVNGNVAEIFTLDMITKRLSGNKSWQNRCFER